jgi:hypothetical protein
MPMLLAHRAALAGVCKKSRIVRARSKLQRVYRRQAWAMSYFISEDDLGSFEGWLRYQGYG